EVIDEINARFGVATIPGMHAIPGARSPFGAAVARRFVEIAGGGLRLDPEPALDVLYPARSDAPMHVGTPNGEAFVEVALAGVRPAARAVVDGLVVYPGVADGIDAIYVAEPERVEEYFYLRHEQAAVALQLEVTTGGRIASLRPVVDGGLEAVD